MKIEGVEGMTTADVVGEVQNGAKFVIYQYCISLLIVTFKRGSDIYFIKAGETALANGIPYTLLSLLLGWWGIPWGPIYTIQSLAVNLAGGNDVTKEVVASMAPLGLPPEERAAFQRHLEEILPAQGHGPTAVMRCTDCGAMVGPGDLSCGNCGTPVRREPRTLPFALLVVVGAAIMVAAVVVLTILWNGSPPVPTPGPAKTPDGDARFLSCRDDVFQNGSSEVLDELMSSMESEEMAETCLKVPDWAARLREAKASYDSCPDPLGPQLVQLRFLEGEYLEEFFLCVHMLIPCCDREADCNLDAAIGHCDRMAELDKAASRQVDAYSAAHADQ